MKIIIFLLTFTFGSCINSTIKEKELDLAQKEIDFKRKEVILKLELDSLDRLKNNQQTKTKEQSFNLSTLEKNYIYAFDKMVTIRVDLLKNNSIRYTSWDNGKNLNTSNPSLVIQDGEVEKQGTMGGYTYTFINKEYKYIVDKRNMAETRESEGIFLSVYKNETLIYHSKMNVKN